tara:strand:- start:455 stop:1027 length:573 start_codon:yes stop_codon:yes gene_type:complete
MPIQTSGQISMQDIRDEIDNDDDDFSLKDAATSQYETINISNLNANKPDNSAPHALSEWYSYQHSPTSVSTSPGSASFSSSGGTATISVSHRTYSTWYVSSKPSWVTISTQQGGTSGNPRSGSGSISYTVGLNGANGGARSGTITVRLNVGTTNGAHPNGSNSSTTRNTTVSQAAGSGGGEGGGGGRGEP